MAIRSIRQKIFFDSLDIKLSLKQNIKLYFAGMALMVTPGASGELIKIVDWNTSPFVLLLPLMMVLDILSLVI